MVRRGDLGDVSRSFQTDKVRALANGNGPTLEIIDADWGISADREKTHKRLAFLEMIARVERHEISVIYAFALDRLARSVQWSARLLDACEDAGTIIVTGEGRFDPRDDRDRQMFHFYAMQNEGALRGMKAKARASAGARRVRKDWLGGRTYGEVRKRRDGSIAGLGEDPRVVVAAFHEAGSYFGAARILNDRKFPARSGRRWYPRTVQVIVNREEPVTVPIGRRPGARAVGSRRFSGLLRCYCGATMGQTCDDKGLPKYRCPAGMTDATHGRPYVISEWKLIETLQAEAAHLRVPFDKYEVAIGNLGERLALDGKRKRWLEMYAEGLIDKSERNERLAAIDDALEELDVSRAMIDIPPTIDWTKSEAVINTQLRALWKYVELGPDLLPVAFTWWVPEWRA